MEIQGPTPRQVEAGRARAAAASRPTSSGAPPAAPGQGDVARVGTDLASVGRMVGILKSMNPLDVHKVEDLRQRIADGEYTAEPEELADLILGAPDRPRDEGREPPPRRR